MTKATMIFLMILLTSGVMAQDFTVDMLRVWPSGDIPFNKDVIELGELLDEENKRFRQVSNPVMFVYRKKGVTKAGPALLYTPGGGYKHVTTGVDRGVAYARLFFKMGFTTVVVLKYRLPDGRIVNEPHKVPLCDAQMALATMHRKADDWYIDRSKVGVKGASAGGHLIASLNNSNDQIVAPGVKRDELVQAFSILRVPVISFKQPYEHKGSHNNLLGDRSDDSKLIEFYSMETRVTKNTPPTFLVFATDDTSVPYQNSEMYIEELKKNKIKFDFVKLGKGGHGFGLNRKKVDKDWIPTLQEFVYSIVGKPAGVS